MKNALEGKKVLMILVLVIIIILILFFTIQMYTYTDQHAPSVTYKIRINKITKTLNGKFYHSCSAADCDSTTYKYSIKLTKDEYKKIMKLWDDKESLSPILESLCEDDEIFYKSFEDSREESQEDYNKLDLNSDGKITSREFANQWLSDVINEIENY